MRPETFRAKNFTWLNDNNDEDQVWYARHILDCNIDVKWGEQIFGYSAAEFMFTLRNKAIWGNKTSIARTTDAEIRILGEVGQGHRHHIPRHFLWMREAWLRLSLNDIFGLPFKYEHTFTLGAFPFELGRGIALGKAFAVGPEVLGFYADSSIDQFAFGAKISGVIESDVLSYDIYGSILKNKANSVSETGAKIYGQEFGRAERPMRGFGVVSLITAGRLIWYPLRHNADYTLLVEPYWLYNSDPEQKLEFNGDTKSRLGTIGISCEYLGDKTEFGFECAQNFGSQRVKGWDRNVIELQNRNGQALLVNSHVLLGVDPSSSSAPSSLAAYKVQHAPLLVNTAGALSDAGKEAQVIINLRSIEDESQNGVLIGTVSGLSDSFNFIPTPVVPAQKDQLYNAKNRYRNPYSNIYKGWMFVADVATWLYKRELEVPWH